MDERAFVDLLCDCRPAWRERRQAIHADAIYYVDVASLGHELVAATVEGEAWTARAFAAIERGLVEGDSLTQNLVVVGMFEAMQGDAYRLEPLGLVEGRLGPASLRAWADLIEGWTGKGVRTVEHWRRVVRNGPIRAVEWEEGGRGFLARLDTRPPEVTFRPGGPTRALAGDELARLQAALTPLVATALLPPEAELGEPLARLAVEGAQGRCEVSVGSRACSDGKRRFTLDLAALRAAWPRA